MTVLLTGVAGFIGMHVAEALLTRGDAVLGIDNLNDYYDVHLKEARLARLEGRKGFRFQRIDIAEAGALGVAIAGDGAVDRIVHLAAQAGVRYSIENPGAYVTANLVGHANVLEAARALGPRLRHLVYASSSSVYGGNTKLPFSVDDPVDRPVSLYAATKKADELMSHAYAHMYGVPATGLRFFTVYGPWGRPDMSAWIFAERILAGRPIPVFNRGDMRRDFTWIGDIVDGVVAALDRPPVAAGAPHRLYNLGNHRSEELLRFIALIEAAVGRKAGIELLPMQPGDVQATYADIEASTADLGFSPKTTIDDGIPVFVAWLRGWLER
ncbi:MAG: NAD-dependent epimerase/dehydratase family protein [Alphaproteobacteria bacterium]|nr:NAD-dependent epimerase/dehydratase family protein [Alphaproteobacteria bacterium]